MNRVLFSQIVSTEMACMEGMETETQFLEVLNSVDSYDVTGDRLVLNKARMAPLARFEAVYMQ
jgi:heat shock protein HslJ